MTVTTLRSLWRELVEEADTTRVPDATADIYFFSALEAFSRRVGYRVNLSGSIAITATTDFALPADCVEVLVVELNTFPLLRSSFKEWRQKEPRNWRSKTGTPEEYDLIGRRIRLYPSPDANAVNDDSTLLVQYIQAPQAFDNTELGFIADQDHRILAYYAAAMWVQNPAKSILGDAYSKSLFLMFETETKEVANQYGRREVSP